MEQERLSPNGADAESAPNNLTPNTPQVNNNEAEASDARVGIPCDEQIPAEGDAPKAECETPRDPEQSQGNQQWQPGTQRCPHCNAVIWPQAQQPPHGQQGAQQQPSQGAQIDDSKMPDKHFVLSIISIVLVGVLGIIPIIYSTKVDDYWYKREFDKAASASKKAKWWSIGLIIFSVLQYVVLILASVFLFSFGAFVSTLENHDDDLYEDNTEEIYDSHYYYQDF